MLNTQADGKTMTEEIFLYSIAGVAVSAAFAFLVKGTGKTVSKGDTGRYNLRMNKLYGIMGVVGLLFGFAFVVRLQAIRAGEKTVHVHQHLVGICKFMKYIQDKTRWTRENLNVPVGK